MHKLLLPLAACLLLAAACQSTPPQPVVPENAPTSQAAEPTTAPTPDEERRVITGATSPDAEPDACKALGGSCAAVGSCGVGQGHLALPNTCGAAYLVCCIPEGQCGGGKEDFACCDGSASFRPACIDGKLTCWEGQTRCAK